MGIWEWACVIAEAQEAQTAVALDVVEGLCHDWCEACTGTSELCQAVVAGANGAKALATVKHNIMFVKREKKEKNREIK